jgi:hypothetical protein
VLSVFVVKETTMGCACSSDTADEKQKKIDYDNSKITVPVYHHMYIYWSDFHEKRCLAERYSDGPTLFYLYQMDSPKFQFPDSLNPSYAQLLKEFLPRLYHTSYHSMGDLVLKDICISVKDNSSEAAEFIKYKESVIKENIEAQETISFQATNIHWFRTIFAHGHSPRETPPIMWSYSNPKTALSNSAIYDYKRYRTAKPINDYYIMGNCLVLPKKTDTAIVRPIKGDSGKKMENSYAVLDERQVFPLVVFHFVCK